MPPSNDNACQQSSKYHIVNDFLYKPINVEEHQTRPNVTLRYSERYYPEDIYRDERQDEDEEEEYRAREYRQRQPVKKNPLKYEPKNQKKKLKKSSKYSTEELFLVFDLRFRLASERAYKIRHQHIVKAHSLRHTDHPMTSIFHCNNGDLKSYFSRPLRVTMKKTTIMRSENERCKSTFNMHFHTRTSLRSAYLHPSIGNHSN